MRVAEIDIVEQIEVLVSELDFAPGFRNGEVLKDREVVVNDPRTPNGVSADIAEGTVGRDAKSVDIEVLIDPLNVWPSLVPGWLLHRQIRVIRPEHYQKMTPAAHDREGVTSLNGCDPVKLPSVQQGTRNAGELVEPRQLP